MSTKIAAMTMCSDDKDGRSGTIIRIAGLPSAATKQEIRDFFYGVNIVNGENGVHLVNRATNNTKPFGEVYIELASCDDLQRAKTFHKKNLGTQYIEVFESSFHEFQSIMNIQRGAQDESLQSTESRNNFGGRNSEKRNVQPNDNNRMYPYGRSGGSNFGRGPNKENCDLVDAPALPSDEQPLSFLRVEALEAMVALLRENIENLVRDHRSERTALENRIIALENAGRGCSCGSMTNVIN